MITWKELSVSPEEEALAREIIESGAGKKLPEEKLYEFQTGEEHSLEIETRAGKTHVNFYLPLGEKENLPLYINIHGGGFIKGMRDQDYVFCRNICSRAGVAVADIDYVPAPHMRYPGQVYACYDVLQYFAQNTAKWNLDREKIAVGGHSAGGNLAAAIILMAIHENAFVPALQILDYPGLELHIPAGKKRNGNSNPRISSWKADFYNKMYADSEFRQEIYCSPGLASDKLLAQMPPTLIMYCENDTFCDEDARFHIRMLEQGVPVYGKRFLNSNHGFVVQRVGEYEIAERMIIQSLKALSEEL